MICAVSLANPLLTPVLIVLWSRVTYVVLELCTKYFPADISPPFPEVYTIFCILNRR